MRVVSGVQKGRILKAVPGSSTRPTTDKVKEAIFNMIGPYFDGGTGLDLFAGSGGLGIEGLSRGLDKVLFIDYDGKAIQTIKDNLATCKFESYAEVYKNDWKRAIKSIIKRNLQFKVIWLDPPYKKNVYIEIIEMINEHNLLEPNGVIVCEHDKGFQFPEQIASYIKRKSEDYGTITISIYE